MVTADAQRLVRGDLSGAVLHQVADQPQVRLRREEPLLLGDVLLVDVGLARSVEQAMVDTSAFGGDHVHAEDRDRRSGDGHRGGHRPEVDAGNSSSRSATESIATPQCPTSPRFLGSSESRPISVGMSNATLSPPPPAARIIL